MLVVMDHNATQEEIEAVVAVDSHGIMVEVHHTPDEALSDGGQSLYPDQFKSLCRQVQSIFEILENGNNLA